MVIEYSLPRISVISSHIIVNNKILIISIFCKQRSSYFPAKTARGRNKLCQNCDRFSNLKVLDITITKETLLINNIKENVSELVIITEVKFIKKFLHAVCEHSHVKKWLKLNVYIGECTWQVVSGDHYFKFVMLRSVVLAQFRKSAGPCPALYQYNGDVVITLYCIVKNQCLAFETNIFCIT